MTKKKDKITKFIHGTELSHADFHSGWITFRTYDGERVTISAKMLFKLLDQFDLEVESWGDHFRTKKFESNDNLGKVDYEADYA